MKIRSLSLALLVSPTLVACGDDGSSETTIPANAAPAISNYAAIVHASYFDSVAGAEALEADVQAFLADPTDANLDQARTSWLAAREPYLQTEVFRFYDGPIDEPEADLEPKINAWPLNEAYIDDIIAGSDAITADTLLDANFVEGDDNVASGWHAIEYLLWGADTNAAGPGDRPATDFTTAEGAERRKTYLDVATTQLVELLGEVDAQWTEGGTNYRAELLAAAPREGLRRILTGMITLSGFETGGERVQAALDSGSQEDEHSCFSDNTHRDMIQDIVGVKNVWEGSYTKVDGSKVSGVGIRDVVGEVDAALVAELDTKIATSLSLANALQAPFDQEIALSNAAGRERVQSLATALRDQETSLQKVFRLFDLSIPVVE